MRTTGHNIHIIYLAIAVICDFVLRCVVIAKKFINAMSYMGVEV